MKAFHRDDAESILIEMYKNFPETLDELPYTEQFNNFHLRFVATTGMVISQHELWIKLLNLRKSGKLPRKKRQINRG